MRPYRWWPGTSPGRSSLWTATVPKWCYGMADGRDLGAMQLARLERFYAACPRDILESRKTQIRILSG